VPGGSKKVTPRPRQKEQSHLAERGERSVSCFMLMARMALYSWSYMARGWAPPPLSTGGAEYLTWREILIDRG